MKCATLTPMKVSRKKFDHIVKRALNRIPSEMREELRNILISVKPRPSQSLLDEMGVPPGEMLLGIFQGVPLSERSVTDPPLYPGTILLFQEPLQEMCTTLEELEHEVELTVVHEIAHFVGIDDERLAELGYE